MEIWQELEQDPAMWARLKRLARDEVEDAEDWERLPDFYDLIHFRNMEGAFTDWPLMYDNVFYSLKPGGWIEVQDFDTVDGMGKFMRTMLREVTGRQWGTIPCPEWSSVC